MMMCAYLQIFEAALFLKEEEDDNTDYLAHAPYVALRQFSVPMLSCRLLILVVC